MNPQMAGQAGQFDSKLTTHGNVSYLDFEVSVSLLLSRKGKIFILWTKAGGWDWVSHQFFSASQARQMSSQVRCLRGAPASSI